MKSNIQVKSTSDTDFSASTTNDWIKFIAVRLNRFGLFEVDDLINEGWVGFMDADKRYDSTCGANFKTYAERRVVGSILDYIRANTPRKRNVTGAPRPKIVSMDEILEAPKDDANNGLFKPLIEALSFTCEEPDIFNYDILHKQINCLQEKQQAVLKMYFWENMTMKDIGKVLGFTEGRISQLVTKALITLHKRIRLGIIPERSDEMKGKALTKEALEERLRVIKESGSVKEAAATLKVSAPTLYILGNKYPAIGAAIKEKRHMRIVKGAQKPEKSARIEKAEAKLFKTSSTFSFKGTITVFGVPYSVDISINPTTVTKDTISA